MALIEMQKSPNGPQAVGPGVGAPQGGPNQILNEYNPIVGSTITDVRQEVDDAYADMKTFIQREPDEIMRMSGGHSARLSELRVKIMRVEDFLPQWRPVRSRDIEPTLDELAKQYQIASRLHSVRELDWKMEQGER